MLTVRTPAPAAQPIEWEAVPTSNGGPMWWRIGLAVLLAAIVTAVCIQRAFVAGPLVGQIQYDDVVYFVWALARVHLLEQSGFWAFIVDHFRHPPHAPFSSALACASFIVFGRNVVAPYIGNFVVVACLLLSTVWFTRRSSLLLSVASMIFVCSVPFTTWCVWNFRPDLIWGVLTAWSCLAVLLIDFNKLSLRNAVALSALIACAYLVKPSIFPSTTASLLAAFGLSVLCSVEKLQFAQIRHAIMQRASVVGMAVLIAVPYYACTLKHLIAYVKYVVFGKYTKEAMFSQMLAPGTSYNRLDELRFYFDGWAGQRNFGVDQYALLALIVLTGVWLLVSRRFVHAKQIGAALAVIAIFFLVPTVTPTKNPWFASSFVAGMVLLGTYCVTLVEQAGRRLTVPLVVLLLGLSVTSFSIRPGCYGSIDDMATNLLNRTYAEISHLIDERSGDREVSLGNTADGPLLGYDFVLDGMFKGKKIDPWRTNPQDGYAPADFIVAQEDNASGCPPNLPGARWQTAALAKLLNDSEYNQLGSWHTWNGRKIYLFERFSDFYGTSAEYGLSPLQHLNAFSWMRVVDGRECGVRLLANAGRSGGTLKLVCWPQAGTTSIRICAEKRTLATFPVTTYKSAMDIVVSIPADVSSVQLVFDGTLDPKTKPSLFTSMKFVDLAGQAMTLKKPEFHLPRPIDVYDTTEWR